MLPPDARLKAGKVTGLQIHKYLEHEMELVFSKEPFTLSGDWGPKPSGMNILFTAHTSPSKRIKAVKIGAADLDHRVYTIGDCDREGEPMYVICRLQGVQDAAYVPGNIHTVLKSYLKAHFPTTPTREGRVRATDLPPVVWSNTPKALENPRGCGSGSRTQQLMPFYLAVSSIIAFTADSTSSAIGSSSVPPNNFASCEGRTVESLCLPFAP